MSRHDAQPAHGTMHQGGADLGLQIACGWPHRLWTSAGRRGPHT